MTQLHVPANPVRFITAASLFDGHDASINIMRRILQSQGAEVIHLGHNRSVDEVVTAAIQEDAQGIAVSSYQGGHVEYFSYLVDLLAERGAGHVQVFGGGGGVIVAEEIETLRAKGVRIFSPEDGQRLGLAGMINEMIKACDVDLAATPPANADALISGETHTLARTITTIEAGKLPGRTGERDRVGRGRPSRPGTRHHRHRRLGQVLAHRRARAPAPPGPAGQAADRGARGRPVPAQGRRRAARRPDPDERPADRHRSRRRVLPLAGHPRRRLRGAGLPDRCHQGLQGGRLRPGHRRDPRHRPGRRRDRRPSSTSPCT